MQALLSPQTELTVIEKKRASWGAMGIKIYQQEMELQIRAQQALSKISVPPVTLDDVPAAEAALKEVGALKRQIEIDRKAITSKFDPVIERLMAPEKSFAIPMHNYASQIISIKKEEERKAAERKYKTDELARTRQTLITMQAHMDAEFKTLIAERVGTAFSFALEKGIKPEEKEDYLDRVKFKIKESLFHIDEPQLNLQYITAAEFADMLEAVWRISPVVYIDLFGAELERKFADYGVAYLNKQEALKQAREQQQQRLREIEEQKQAAETAATLDAISTDMSVEPSGLKALKKCYEIDMPESFENAMKILSAFMANKQKCFEKVNIRKWFSFDAASAGKALAKVKSEDNAFAPLGILFKEVDKL